MAAGQVLTLSGAVSKFTDASVTNKGTVVALDHLRLQNGKTFTNDGLVDLQSTDGLIDGGFGGLFLNNGILRKSVAGGTSTVSGIDTTHNGEINVQTGTLAFTTGTHRFNGGTMFTGPGQVTVGNGATFAGGFTTNDNLSLNGGVFVGGDGSPGSKATMNGNMAWTAGELQGSWEIAASRVLTLTGSIYVKYMDASVTNKGTVVALDHLRFQNGNVFTNDGLFDLQNDDDMLDGGFGGVFQNNGQLIKSGGVGTSSVAAIGFVNAAGGVVDVRVGTIQLADGFTNSGTLMGVGTFSTNTLTNDGHVAPGVRPVR